MPADNTTPKKESQATQPGLYYKLAQKALGRKRIFKTANEFIVEFLDYVEWCENNPIVAKKASKREKGETGSELRTEAESKRRPMSMYGLCAHLGVSRKYFEMAIKNLDSKGDTRTEEENELFTALTRARTIIENQMFEGACVNEFNPNLIIRALGLGEKVDMTTDGEALNSLPTSTIINIMRDERCGRKAEQ